jgi:TetR/AcrR family transcriptional regulator
MPKSRAKLEKAVASAGSDDSRRKRILWAAAEQFAEKGLAAVRIDEIASAAECNKQLIYYYFGSKMGLYTATLELMIDRIVPGWTAMESLGGLQALIGVDLRGGEGSMWFRLLAWEGLQSAGSASGEISLWDERRASLLRYPSSVERAKGLGQVPAEADAEMLGLVILLTNVAPQILPQVVELMTGLPVESDEFVVRYRRTLMSLLGLPQDVPPVSG